MVKFSEEKLAKVKEIMLRYPEGKQKSALLPVLHIAQDTFGGWLSSATMDYVAELLSIQPIEVYEVATFYSMYNLKPVGKYMFEVCQTGPCMLNGSDHIIDYITNALGIKPGETTADGLFTVLPNVCLGCCDCAPALMVDGDLYKNVKKEELDEILKKYR